MPLLARTWTCAHLQPTIGTNPVFYFRSDPCIFFGNEMGFAADKWNGENLISQLSSRASQTFPRVAAAV